MSKNKKDKMSDRRKKYIDVFNETLDMCTKNSRLKDSIINTISKTKYYTNDSPYSAVRKNISSEAKISLVDGRSMELAKTVWNSFSNKKEKRIAVLNFASATTPGGGVQKGSSAQEESLCRVSTLYPCLSTELNMTRYYRPNREGGSRLYNHLAIYTPDVVVFREDNKRMDILPESEWFTVDVITCPAPNLRSYRFNQYNPDDNSTTIESMLEKVARENGGVTKTDKEINELLLKTYEERIKSIIIAAMDNKVTDLILGAWGCGAFRNSPKLIATAFKNVLENNVNEMFTVVPPIWMFDEIYFPIPKDLTGNYKEFAEVFKITEE